MPALAARFGNSGLELDEKQDRRFHLRIRGRASRLGGAGAPRNRVGQIVSDCQRSYIVL